MGCIADNLFAIKKRIQEAEKKFHRRDGAVSLLAVTKAQPVEKIVEAVEAGQTEFGENYLQEALIKIKALRQYLLNWHFIGGIQTNKTRALAENFSWVHSVCRYSVAARLNNQRPDNFPPLNICIQVNISEEKTKEGVHPSELLELAEALSALKRLKLRGLMAIPEYGADFSKQRQIFREVSDAQQRLIDRGFELDTLSMGMTQDFEAAIAEGSTIVRVGRAIFGERN